MLCASFLFIGELFVHEEVDGVSIEALNVEVDEYLLELLLSVEGILPSIIVHSLINHLTKNIIRANNSSINGTHYIRIL